MRPQPQGPRQPGRCDAAAPRWPARSPRPSPRACGRAGRVSPRGRGCGASQPPTTPCGARDRRARTPSRRRSEWDSRRARPCRRPSDRWSRTADASSADGVVAAIHREPARSPIERREFVRPESKHRHAECFQHLHRPRQIEDGLGAGRHDGDRNPRKCRQVGGNVAAFGRVAMHARRCLRWRTPVSRWHVRRTSWPRRSWSRADRMTLPRRGY